MTDEPPKNPTSEEIAKAVWKASTSENGSVAGSFGALASSDGNFTSGQARAGSPNTITIAADAPDLTARPNSIVWLFLYEGTGKGQETRIIAFDAATKVATIPGEWFVRPDATTRYSVGIVIDDRPVVDLNLDQAIPGAPGANVGAALTAAFGFRSLANTVLRRLLSAVDGSQPIDKNPEPSIDADSENTFRID